MYHLINLTLKPMHHWPLRPYSCPDLLLLHFHHNHLEQSTTPAASPFPPQSPDELEQSITPAASPFPPQSPDELEQSTTPAASPFPLHSPDQLSSSNPSDEQSTTPAASLFPPQSPDQLSSSNPSNEQSHSQVERDVMVLSDQEESSTATASDAGLLPDDSNSSSKLIYKEAFVCREITKANQR